MIREGAVNRFEELGAAIVKNAGLAGAFGLCVQTDKRCSGSIRSSSAATFDPCGCPGQRSEIGNPFNTPQAAFASLSRKNFVAFDPFLGVTWNVCYAHHCFT